MELVRAVGGISWVVGILILFVSPTVGLVVLTVALLFTVWSVSKTREKRHQELLEAARSVRESGG
jgi:Flp pilus assembly protein TadB